MEVNICGVKQVRLGQRFIKKKCADKKLALIERNKLGWKKKSPKKRPITSVVGGRRLVHIGHISRQMYCKSCDKPLALQNIEEESEHGLASVFTVRCHHCLDVTRVSTDKQTEVTGTEATRRAFIYDSNLKIALGVLHSGIGFTHINKILACLNAHPLPWKTYKSCERRVGRLIENVAKEICKQAALEERELTLKNIKKLKKLLPEGLDETFLLPHLAERRDDISKNNHAIVTSTPAPTAPSSSLIPTTEKSPSPDIASCSTPIETDNSSACKRLFGTSTLPSAIYQAFMTANNYDDEEIMAMNLDSSDEQLSPGSAQVTQSNHDMMVSTDESHSEGGQFHHFPGPSTSGQILHRSSSPPSPALLQDNTNKVDLNESFTILELGVRSSTDTNPSRCDTSPRRQQLVQVEDSIIVDYDSDKENVTPTKRVRGRFNYDMGWSMKGSGRRYDSLNGYGALIGHFSGKVVDYATRNRKCAKCGQRFKRKEVSHDCRKNWSGTSKGMEADVGATLCTKSSILKEVNMEVGILCGDDDASTIKAVRAVSSHPVVKLSDINHTQKGLSNCLYEMKGFKDLNSNAIDYLKRCFSYALAQNVGNVTGLATALRAIPLHIYNDHSLCMEWCGHVKGIENYDHTMVPGGFNDSRLRDKLVKIFEELAQKCHKFAFGSSSQGCESLNSSMAHHASKMICYSLSESADFRFACSVSEKNCGDDYLHKVQEILQQSPTAKASKYFSQRKRKRDSRKRVSESKEGKKRRLQLKQERKQLRMNKEKREGTTYQSDVGLFTDSVINDAILFNGAQDLPTVQSPIVYFDLETGGFGAKADILQIAARCNASNFDIYINPIEQISLRATKINGFTNVHGELYLHGRRLLNTVPRREALRQFLAFLSGFSGRCILVAHNANFDRDHLFRAMQKEGLFHELSNLVYGICDTLQIFRHMYPERKGKGAHTLLGLYNVIVGKQVENAHNALIDVIMLEEAVEAANITTGMLIEYTSSLHSILQAQEDTKIRDEKVARLDPLNDYVSVDSKKKMVEHDITLDKLIDSFTVGGEKGVRDLLTECDCDGKAKVSQNGRVIRGFLDFLDTLVIN